MDYRTQTLIIRFTEQSPRRIIYDCATQLEKVPIVIGPATMINKYYLNHFRRQ